MAARPGDADFEIQLEQKEQMLLKRIAEAARSVRGSELILAEKPDDLSNAVLALRHLVETNRVFVEGDVSTPRKMLDSRFFVPISNFKHAFQK